MTRFDSNSSLGSRDLFDNSLLYSQEAYKGINSNLYMDLESDFRHYGKVDKSFYPIIPTGEGLSGFRSSQTTAQSHDFVVMAYNDLESHIQRAVNARKVSVKNTFLFNMTPVKSFVPVYEEYSRNFGRIYELFEEDFLSKKSNTDSIRTIKEFTVKLKSWLLSSHTDLPINLSSFLLSSRSSNNLSGLIVSIADLPKHNLALNDDAFIQSQVFPFYINAARKYGFVVNKNAPWELIADVSSKYMIPYMNKVGIASTESLFQERFQRAQFDDIDYLKRIIHSFYSLYISKNPTIVLEKTIKCGRELKAQINSIERKPITLSEYGSLFNDYFWYNFYFDLKVKEESITLEDNMRKIKKKFLLKLLRIYKDKGISLDQYNLYFNNLIYSYSQRLHFNPSTSNKAKFYLKNDRIPNNYEEFVPPQESTPPVQIVGSRNY